MPLSSDLPQKRPRASATATAMPKGRLANMAMEDTHRLSLIAVHSSGLSVHQCKSISYNRHLSRSHTGWDRETQFISKR